MLQIVFMEGSNLLCEFQNYEQQTTELLRKQTYVEQKPSLKHEANPNPNAMVHLIRKIYQNNLQFQKGVFNVRAHLDNYRASINFTIFVKETYRRFVPNNLTPSQLTHKVQYNLEHTLQEIYQHMVGMKEQISAEEFTMLEQRIRERPALRIFRITPMKADDDKKTVDLCINKLKVMVLKSLYKDSANLEYLIECYTSHLKAALNEHSLKYKEGEKSQKYRLIELYFSRHAFLLSALMAIANKFDIIGPQQLQQCKIAPHKYFSAIRRKFIQNEHPIFFINFYTEHLLFVDSQYISFDNDLLFCPVVSKGITIGLSAFYKSKLAQECISWASQQLYIEVYHNATSSMVPIFFSCIKQQIPAVSGVAYEKQTEELVGTKHYRFKKETKNLDKIVATISKVRKFVFVRLIHNWLAQLYGFSNKEQVHIDILGRFKIVIKRVAQPINYSKMTRIPEERPQFMTNLLFVAANKKNPSYSHQFLRQKIYSTFQAVLLKLAAEKTGYKVSWPLEPGSTGQHYFDYTKDKNITRKEVKQFINNF